MLFHYADDLSGSQGSSTFPKMSMCEHAAIAFVKTEEDFPWQSDSYRISSFFKKQGRW